jgi:hypothetical protein
MQKFNDKKTVLKVNRCTMQLHILLYQVHIRLLCAIPALDLPALTLPALTLTTSLIWLSPMVGEHHRTDVKLVLEYWLPGHILHIGHVCVEDTNASI